MHTQVAMSMHDSFGVILLMASPTPLMVFQLEAEPFCVRGNMQHEGGCLRGLLGVRGVYMQCHDGSCLTP